MEVRIRLQRSGRSSKHRYNYRVVAISRNEGRDSRHLEILGHYDPAKKPAEININQEKLDKWISRGASMSDTVRTIVKKQKK